MQNIIKYEFLKRWDTLAFGLSLKPDVAVTSRLQLAQTLEAANNWSTRDVNAFLRPKNLHTYIAIVCSLIFPFKWNVDLRCKTVVKTLNGMPPNG